MKINKEHIVCVYQYNKKLVRYWTYTEQPEKRFLGIVTEPAKKGYKTFGSGIWTAEQVIAEEKVIFEEENKLYYFPYLYFQMSDNSSFCKYFKTIGELEVWTEENLKDVNFIEL